MHRVRAAYLAADGCEGLLAGEAAHRGIAVAGRYGRLLLSDAPAVHLAWAANTWLEPAWVEAPTIAAAARALRERHGLWACYAPGHAGRARLIAERLPHVSSRPLTLGRPAPEAPLGSWALLWPEQMLASARCTSPFPNGEVSLAEDPTGPPSRAYLKLWEAFVRLGRFPAPGERCVDLGASPGGWTWLLARLGATVLAVDKAPLDARVGDLAGVRWQRASAYALAPEDVGPVDWLCCDVVGYPARLLGVVERWVASAMAARVVATIKFQGDVDHGVADAFADVGGALVAHLHHNRHELTFLWPAPAAGIAAAATVAPD